MLLRLQKYELTLKYVKGKYLYVADSLSRAHSDEPPEEDLDSADLDAAIHVVLQNLPITEPRMMDLQTSTNQDDQLQQLKRLIDSGWPNNVNNVPQALREFWNVKEDLYVADNLILKGHRVVVPASRRQLVLKAIHQGHLGIEKCKARARSCVYWPSMNKDIEQEVKKCPACNEYSKAIQKEPLTPHAVPTRAWENVGADYFTFKNQDYFLMVDYFSKYPEVVPVNNKTAETTIKVMKTIFARHGIPLTVVADNMPFSSKALRKFSQEWHFTITTSSPHFPQSNGLAERYVQTMKQILKKAKVSDTDVDLALLEFRNTAITGMSASPAQLLMGRNLRSSLPMLPSQLTPPNSSTVREKLQIRQSKQKYNFDKTSKALPPLKPNDRVRYKCGSKWKPAVVVAKHVSPRSYVVKNTNGTLLRRNRRHLKKTLESAPRSLRYVEDSEGEDVVPTVMQHGDSRFDQSVPLTPSSSSVRQSRYGRIIRPPIRYRGESED